MNEAEILDYLTTQGIDYEYQRHPAVLTMDEAERLALPHPECEARNLFVRESRTHRYFLLTAHARVDLKAFSRQQGLRSLSFASADELREKYPERKILTIDSLGASLGEGLYVYLAAKKQQSGATIEEPSRRWPC